MLAIKNKHPNDEYIQFSELGHRYTIKGKYGYNSVTTLAHKFFEKFNPDAVIKRMMASKNWPNSPYFNMTAPEIKKQWNDKGKLAAANGTLMHEKIEDFYNGKEIDEKYKELDTWKHFMVFHEENHEFEAYRTEWAIYDEEYKLAGSIDMVVKNPDGTYSILDWKNSDKIEKESQYEKYCRFPGLENIPDTAYWHYTFQLNIYRFILEKNYGIKIKSLHLIYIQPATLANYKKLDVPILKDEINIIMDSQKSTGSNK